MAQIVHPSILNEIDNKKLIIESSDSANLYSLALAALEHDALAHSDRIENAAITCREGRMTRRRMSEVRGSLNGAWKYAVDNLNGPITRDFLIDIARLIEPKSNRQYGYRTEKVIISGDDSISPPSAEKVEKQMEALLRHVNREGLHPVERAAFFHLHNARVHPFIDGNGRSSRLVQNAILFKEGYAPATVPSEERLVYQDSLRGGIRGYQDAESQSSFDQMWNNSDMPISEREHNFFNYLASKTSVAMESQIQEIDRLPRYVVNFDGKYEAGDVVGAKRVIDAYFRRGRYIGQVRVDARNGKKDGLIVRGEQISESLLTKILGASCKASFSVSPFEQD